jgi:hypothetical protein
VEKKFYELTGDPDGLVWLAQYSNHVPEAFCKKHRIKLIIGDDVDELYCPEDNELFSLKNDISVVEELARQKIFRDDVKDLKIVKIDPEGYQVIAKETVKTDPKFWVEAKLSNTNRGLQLMVQVGKKDESGQKVQLFIEPAAKRMDFDRGGSDIHPTGIFSKVTAEFKDSSTIISEKPDTKGTK